MDNQNQQTLSVPIGVLRSVIAATWMNGVNAGVNEGYAAHEDTDQQTERVLALLRPGTDASARALLQEVVASCPAVRDLDRRMDREPQWPAAVDRHTEDADA